MTSFKLVQNELGEYGVVGPDGELEKINVAEDWDPRDRGIPRPTWDEWTRNRAIAERELAKRIEWVEEKHKRNSWKGVEK